MPKQHIKWTTLPTLYVDLDTGEQLTKYQTKNYTFIKSEKHAKTQPINLSRPKDGQRGIIQWTKCYRKSTQGRLF